MPLFGRRPAPAPTPEVPRWKVEADPPDGFSSGIAGLDSLLGGGYRAGSVNLWEGDLSTGPDDYWLAVLPTLLNFLVQGRGALLVPPQSLGPRRASDRLLECIPRELVASRIRIVDYTNYRAEEPWIVPLARLGRDAAMRAMVQAERAVAGTPRRPFLEAPAIESFEQIMGREVALRMFNSGFSRTRSIGGLTVAWGRPSLTVEPQVGAMTDTMLVLSRNSNGPGVQGLRPPFSRRGLLWESGGADSTIHSALTLES